MQKWWPVHWQKNIYKKAAVIQRGNLLWQCVKSTTIHPQQHQRDSKCSARLFVSAVTDLIDCWLTNRPSLISPQLQFFNISHSVTSTDPTASVCWASGHMFHSSTWPRPAEREVLGPAQGGQSKHTNETLIGAYFRPWPPAPTFPSLAHWHAPRSLLSASHEWVYGCVSKSFCIGHRAHFLHLLILSMLSFYVKVHFQDACFLSGLSERYATQKVWPTLTQKPLKISQTSNTCEYLFFFYYSCCHWFLHVDNIVEIQKEAGYLFKIPASGNNLDFVIHSLHCVPVQARVSHASFEFNPVVQVGTLSFFEELFCLMMNL